MHVLGKLVCLICFLTLSASSLSSCGWFTVLIQRRYPKDKNLYNLEKVPKVHISCQECLNDEKLKETKWDTCRVSSLGARSRVAPSDRLPSRIFRNSNSTILHGFDLLLSCHILICSSTPPLLADCVQRLCKSAWSTNFIYWSFLVKASILQGVTILRLSFLVVLNLAKLTCERYLVLLCDRRQTPAWCLLCRLCLTIK